MFRRKGFPLRSSRCTSLTQFPGDKENFPGLFRKLQTLVETNTQQTSLQFSSRTGWNNHTHKLVNMGVKCCVLPLRTGTIIIGIIFLVIAVIHFIVSVAFINSSAPGTQVLEGVSSEDEITEDDVFRWAVEYLKHKKSAYTVNSGSANSPNNFLTGTVEAKITTSPRLSTVGSERFKISQLAVSIIHILSNLALIVGAVKRNGNFVSLWLWLEMVLFIVRFLCCVIFTLVIFAYGLNTIGAAIITVFLLLSCLFAFCYMKVYKFYHELYVPLCPSTKLDANDSTKVAYELKSFPSDAEYV